MNLILDTNVVYAANVVNDPLHKKALKLIDSLDDKSKIFIPFIVVAELQASGDKKDFLEIAKNISNKLVSTEEKDLEFIEEKISYSTRRKLKANDCIILAVAYRKNAKLITLDKKLQKIADELL